MAETWVRGTHLKPPSVLNSSTFNSSSFKMPIPQWQVDRIGPYITNLLEALLSAEAVESQTASRDIDSHSQRSDLENDELSLGELASILVDDTESVLSTSTTSNNSQELQQTSESDTLSVESQEPYSWIALEASLLDYILPRMSYESFAQLLDSIGILYPLERMREFEQLALRTCPETGLLHVFERNRKFIQYRAQLCEVHLYPPFSQKLPLPSDF